MRGHITYPPKQQDEDFVELFNVEEIHAVLGIGALWYAREGKWHGRAFVNGTQKFPWPASSSRLQWRYHGDITTTTDPVAWLTKNRHAGARLYVRIEN